MKTRLIPLCMLVAGLALAGDIGLNSSVRIGDGEVREDGVSAVNGRITIGDGATVRGACSTVNGSISVGERSDIVALQTVNGSVEVGADTVVHGAVSAVNGHVALDQGARAEDVTTVNGGIALEAAEVERDVVTVNGDIGLSRGATVGGDILVRERGKGSSKRDRPLRIELEGGSVVRGSILVEDPSDEVEVYLRDGSSVAGRIENAKVIER